MLLPGKVALVLHIRVNFFAIDLSRYSGIQMLDLVRCRSNVLCYFIKLISDSRFFLLYVKPLLVVVFVLLFHFFALALLGEHVYPHLAFRVNYYGLADENLVLFQ